MKRNLIFSLIFALIYITGCAKCIPGDIDPNNQYFLGGSEGLVYAGGVLENKGEWIARNIYLDNKALGDLRGLSHENYYYYKGHCIKWNMTTVKGGSIEASGSQLNYTYGTGTIIGLCLPAESAMCSYRNPYFVSSSPVQIVKFLQTDEGFSFNLVNMGKGKAGNARIIIDAMKINLSCDGQEIEDVTNNTVSCAITSIPTNISYISRLNITATFDYSEALD